MERIMMPSYTDDEKITIGRDYVLPKILKESGLTGDSLKIDSAIWTNIVRPLGFDAGIRTLERTINNMVRKVAIDVVSGKAKQVVLNEGNIKQYLPQ